MIPDSKGSTAGKGTHRLDGRPGEAFLPGLGDPNGLHGPDDGHKIMLPDAPGSRTSKTGEGSSRTALHHQDPPIVDGGRLEQDLFQRDARHGTVDGRGARASTRGDGRSEGETISPRVQVAVARGLSNPDTPDGAATRAGETPDAVVWDARVNVPDTGGSKPSSNDEHRIGADGEEIEIPEPPTEVMC